MFILDKGEKIENGEGSGKTPPPPKK